MSPWTYLGIAIVFEVAGTLFLKLSEGFAHWQWGALSIFFYALCFVMLAPALRDLPVGVVYAIWSGVGIIGATALGILIFGDRLAVYQYGCVALILVGAIGLRLTSTT